MYLRLRLLVRSCQRAACEKPNASFGQIQDRKNASLTYVTACQYCYNVIFNSVPVFLLDKLDEVNKINASGYSLCFTDESEAEVILIMKSLTDAINGDKVGTLDSFTRGHFTRGVE